MINKHIADYLIDKNNIIFYLIFVFFFSILFHLVLFLATFSLWSFHH